MNPDQLKGKWMRFKGDLTQQQRKHTDDALQQIEGTDDQLVGKVQESYDEPNDGLMKWLDQWWHQRPQPEATKKQTRNGK